ncbi:hypothetical protein V6Z92_007740, partial [Aspergillus fumigatus]
TSNYALHEELNAVLMNRPQAPMITCRTFAEGRYDHQTISKSEKPSKLPTLFLVSKGTTRDSFI